MPTIVISGMPGTGSSTTAKMLSKKLGLKHFSAGDRNKGLVEKFTGKDVKKETEKSIEMWKSEKGSSREFHMNTDDLVKELAKEGNIIIDGKLVVHMTKGIASFSVWLRADFSIRAGRVAERDNISIEEATKELKEKEKLERKSWEKIYGFDYFDQEEEADLVIDNSSISREEVVECILKKMKKGKII